MRVVTIDDVMSAYAEIAQLKKELAETKTELEKTINFCVGCGRWKSEHCKWGSGKICGKWKD